mmetsp:Transcript_32711/g.5950  ORF Transcript_32711/g.5950 Transcript_32711/m.5950 type:complete len:99 (-) Transcript_32711:1031-1327(-)
MAVRKSDGAKRAVKLILKSRVKRHELLLREVNILREVDHPNIVKLYEIYEDRNYIYMVMELCEGGELFDMLIDTGVFTEDKAYKVVRQMLLAVNYLHD